MDGEGRVNYRAMVSLTDPRDCTILAVSTEEVGAILGNEEARFAGMAKSQ